MAEEKIRRLKAYLLIWRKGSGSQYVIENDRSKKKSVLVVHKVVFLVWMVI